MFSEYASRFLAQSQSRLGFDQQPTSPPPQSDHDRNMLSPTHQRRYAQRPTVNQNRAATSRSYLQRPSMLNNPYAESGSQQFTSRFNFASRQLPREAPLFYSATDEFREQDDGEEREREFNDHYALQRSRRHFSVDKLDESEEKEEDAEDEGSGDEAGHQENALSRQYVSGAGRGIRSSWRGERKQIRGRPPATVEESVMESPEQERGRSAASETTDTNGKGRMENVDLGSSRRSSDSLESIHAEEAEDDDDRPPPFQNFPKTLGNGKGITREHRWIPEETDEETAHLNPRPPSADRESVPDMLTSELGEGTSTPTPRHDWFWAQLFWIALASLFATSLLVYLNTDTPSSKKPLGDSIYAVLHKSLHLLAVDTLVALVVSAIWLALLRSYIRPLTFLTLIAVPIILFSFSLYALVSSYKGYWHGTRFQDKIMRLLAFAPMLGTGLWVYLAYKSRHSLDRAIQILEFACKILTASPVLQLVGFATQGVVVVWYWIWFSLFTRVFLEGHFSKGVWRLWGSTWWLAIYHVLMLLWVLSVVSGVQRAITAATTSQWYFHRNALPSPSSRQVVTASFTHATTQLFGTVCQQAFLGVAVRLPILVLPRRLVTLFTMCFYNLVPSPVAALTNPLTLTYAAIHSQPLTVAARQLSNLPFVSRTEATTTLSLRSANAPPSDALTHWRLAKLILHAFRYILTISMGFGGWVSTARLVQVAPDYKGSLYAYVIGLSAAAVGWSVFGAVENVIVGIVDAIVVCWASEMASAGGVRYCREAGELLGGGERGWEATDGEGRV